MYPEKNLLKLDRMKSMRLDYPKSAGAMRDLLRSLGTLEVHAQGIDSRIHDKVKEIISLTKDAHDALKELETKLHGVESVLRTLKVKKKRIGEP